LARVLLFLQPSSAKAGKEDDAKGQLKKSADRVGASGFAGYRAVPDNNENDTPPHTSKRPTPRESGVFFTRRKPRGDWSESSRGRLG